MVSNLQIILIYSPLMAMPYVKSLFLQERETHITSESEVEKHLLSQDAVETLLEGVVTEGVLYFRTP